MTWRLVLGLLVFEAVCAAFFLVNILSAYLGYRPLSWRVHELVEIGVVVGLCIGIALTSRLLVLSRRQAERAEAALRAASGAFQDLLEERFTQWGLTPAERDVALFMIKGYPTQEIANLRGSSPGTVKAQTNAIYRKSGVSSRAQLVSLFVEELIMDPLVQKERDDPAAKKVTP